MLDAINTEMSGNKGLSKKQENEQIATSVPQVIELHFLLICHIFEVKDFIFEPWRNNMFNASPK